MKNLKKFFYYLRNDPKYILSFLNYKIKSSKSLFFVFIRYLFALSKIPIRNNSNLLFVYDLELNPLTYNFGQYLANATIYSRNKSLKKIDLLIIKSRDRNPIKTKKLKQFFSEHEAENRIYEILISTFRLNQKSNNLYLSNFNDKNIHNILKSYNHIYPVDYSLFKPIPCQNKLPNVNASIFFPMIRPNLRGKEIIKKYLENFGNKKIITFTFRDLKHETNRNSQYSEWLKFSQYLIKKNFEVFLVPDPINYNPKFFDQFSGCHVAEIVLWNMNLRAALYEAAFLNCSVSSGVYEVSSFYNESSKNMMFLDFDSYGKEYLKSAEKKWGYTDSIYQKWMSTNQTIIYKKDNFENLISAFDELQKRKYFK